MYTWGINSNHTVEKATNYKILKISTVASLKLLQFLDEALWSAICIYCWSTSQIMSRNLPVSFSSHNHSKTWKPLFTEICRWRREKKFCSLPCQTWLMLQLSLNLWTLEVFNALLLHFFQSFLDKFLNICHIFSDLCDV